MEIPLKDREDIHSMTNRPPEVAGREPSAVPLPASRGPESANKNVPEGRALRTCALFAAGLILWITHPVGVGVLLGTLTAFTMLPLYVRLRSRWQRPALAALFCVLLTTLGAGTAFAGFMFLLIGRGVVLIGKLVVILQPGGSLRVFFESQNALLPRLGVHPGTIAERVGGAAAEVSSRLTSLAPAVAGTMGSGVMQIFFLIVTMFFVLLHWSSLIQRAAIMLPLEPRDTRALFEEFRRVGRSVLLGAVLTGMAQGVLAGIGFYLTHVPEAAFFGALTAIASLMPGAGTLLVWVPAGIYLLVTGHGGRGLVELLYGAFVVVGFSDYVLRPRLVGGDGNVPALLTFIALFGALEVFGLIGLVLGPVLMTLALAVLRIYEREATLRRESEVAAALAQIQSAP